MPASGGLGGDDPLRLPAEAAIPCELHWLSAILPAGWTTAAALTDRLPD
jgi:hypothetical protein